MPFDNMASFLQLDVWSTFSQADFKMDTSRHARTSKKEYIRKVCCCRGAIYRRTLVGFWVHTTCAVRQQLCKGRSGFGLASTKEAAAGIELGIVISHLAALERASFQSIRRVSAALVSRKAAVSSSHEHALASAHHGNGAHLPA